MFFIFLVFKNVWYLVSLLNELFIDVYLLSNKFINERK